MNNYTILDCKSRCNTHTSLIDNNENIPNIVEEINLLYGCNLYENENYNTIGKHTYHKHLLLNDCKIQFDIARKLLRQAEDVLRSDMRNLQIADTRKHIIGLLTMVRNIVTPNNNKTDCETQSLRQCLKIFKRGITKLNSLDDFTINDVIASTRNAQGLQLSQYFHMHLDVLWLLLSINHFVNDDVEADIKDLMSQLIYVGFKDYEKKGAQKCEPYTCTCMKVMWLRLQLFCENNFHDFWDIFNTLVSAYVNDEFAITLLRNVATLQCFSNNGAFIGVKNKRIVDNFEYLNKKWSEIIKNHDGLQLKMFQFLRLTDYLVTELWLPSAKLDFHKTTWDYFCKHIESVDCKIPNNLKGFLASIKKIRTNSQEIETGYELFLSMLYRHLLTHDQHWSKFRGQIYTKFSNAKFSKLNDKGIFNVSLLLLSFSSISFNEISVKLLEMLKSLPIDKQNTVVVWNLHMALIHLNLQANVDIQQYSEHFQTLVMEASLNRTQYYLITLHISCLEQLLSANDNLRLHQTVLFNPWICRYTQTCQYNDLCLLLNFLIWAAEKLVENNVWSEYENSFSDNVLPALKQLALNQSTSLLVGSLAAIIATNSRALLYPTIQFFTNDNISSVVLNPFFINVLKYYQSNYMNVTNIENMILKGWIQCCLIGEVTENFTKLVFDLNIFKTLFDEFDFNVKENLASLIEAIGSKLSTNMNRAKIKEMVILAFGSLDKFVTKQLNSNSESVILQIYTYFALLLNNCSSILYSNSADLCYFSKYIDLLLLSTDVLRGKCPNVLVLKAIEKTWYLYVQTLFKLYNSENCDPHLERLLKHLIVRYIPHFQTKTPFIQLLADTELTVFALGKINAEYFTRASSEEHSAKAFTLIRNILVYSSRMDVELLKSVILTIMPGIFEAYIFKTNKGMVIDTIKVLVQSDYYSNRQLVSEIKKCYMDFTKKHLPFNTLIYFQLTLILTKIISTELKLLLPFIKDEIHIIESKRGKGFDNSLRQGFDRISKALL